MPLTQFYLNKYRDYKPYSFEGAWVKDLRNPWAEIKRKTPMSLYVGVIGKREAGKTTVVGRALTEMGFKRYHPMDLGREMLRPFLLACGISEDQLDDYLTGSRKAEVIDFLGMSSVELQQTLGTEWGRDCVDTSIWTRLLHRRQEQNGDSFYFNDSIRFLSEASDVKARGGLLLRIVRPEHVSGGSESVKAHVSETEQDIIPHDLLILNDDSIEVVVQRVKDTIYDWAAWAEKRLPVYSVEEGKFVVPERLPL